MNEPVDQTISGWEYLLFADELERRFDGSAGLRAAMWTPVDRASVTGEIIEDPLETLHFVLARSESLTRFTEDFGAVVSEARLIDAFGAPGEPGDPTEIRRLAGDIVAAFEDILRWSLETRACSGPDRIGHAIKSVAALSSEPIAQFERWILDAIDAIRQVVGGGPPKEGEPVKVINLTLTLAIDPEATANAQAAIEALAAGVVGPTSTTSDDLLHQFRAVTHELDDPRARPEGIRRGELGE